MRSAAPRALKSTGAVAAAGALLLAAACAQADDIATDRPDFVESSDVVGKGVFQIETSFAYESDRNDGVRTRVRSTPTLLRYGISDTVELRAETDGYLHERVRAGGVSDTESGAADASIGLKWHLQDGDAAGHRPALALLAHVDLESGSAAFRAPAEVPSLRVVAEWELPGDAAFGVMGGAAYDKDELRDDRYWSGILAATYSRPLIGALRGFVEVAGQALRGERRGGDVVTFDTGVTYALSSDTLVDLSVNLGLNEHTPDRAIGIGFSHRFR
ncbi:MAG: transporter [Immundisolibacter sp.]|uniref:transporter n=1 Tax=Immundisolibacter sp. TaxID=1934948 RepID=UPI003D1443A8